MMTTRRPQQWWWPALLLLAVCCGPPAAGGAEDQDFSRLCEELKKSGFTILDSGVAYGVPYVRVKIPTGFSVTSFCRRIPSFQANFNSCRNRVAFFNALHPSLVKTKEPERHSITADSVIIPLDLRKVPEIFPARDDSLAGEQKYLIVDIGKGFLAYYERGELKRVFPISAGGAGKKTPLFDFRIGLKSENHWSGIYDTWMPWALHLRGPYYIHGGVLPGRDDSAGCVRLFIEDAKELYHLVDVGTPGRIIQTPKLEKVYAAPFCR